MHNPPNPNRDQPHSFSGPFAPSELPIDKDGCVYHLQVSPDQIAPDILLVGDPGRAEMIGSTFLHDLETEHEHRGLVTITGISELTGEPATIISPLKTTVTTSGMGTPSLEVVVNELVLLNEVDFQTRMRKTEYPELHILRVGTSGGLQVDTTLGTAIITTYAIGMDNTGLFYEVPYPNSISERMEKELCELLSASMPSDSRFSGKLHPYISRAAPSLVIALEKASTKLGVKSKLGLTVSNAGFFAPQGRDISRIKPSLLGIERFFSEYDPKIEGQRVENMEMEASFLLHFLSGLGYLAGTICTVIANRRINTFQPDYQQAVVNTIRVGLLALGTLRKQTEEERLD